MPNKRIYKLIVAPETNIPEIEYLLSLLKEGYLVYSEYLLNHKPLKLVQAGEPLITEVFCDESIYEMLKEDKNKYYEFNQIGGKIILANDSVYYSEIQGVFCIKDNMPFVIPVSFDAYYSIRISEDNMQVKGDFYPPVLSGKKILIKEVYAKLRELKINCEIRTSYLEGILENLKDSPAKNILIAEGKNPLEGTDYSVQYMVNFETSFSPTVLEDGRLDFYNLNSIVSVSKDQLLAIYYHEIEGVDGFDVFGNKLPAHPVKKGKLPLGKNTYEKREDCSRIFATIDGCVSMKNSLINVSEVQIIRSNIDYSTGNVNCKASLQVIGDVKNGFRVDAEDNIQISGIVEDSVINAGSNIAIDRGFIGTGSGIIYSGGDVDIRYVRNQRIHSRNNINVLNEAIDCELFARNRIQVVGGKNMAVFGGHLIAGNSIEANCIGNEYGVKTIVEVGYDYDLINQLNNNNIELKQLESSMENIKNGITQICRVISLSAEQKKALEVLVEQKLLLFTTSDGLKVDKVKLEKVESGIDLLLRCSKMDTEKINNFKLLLNQRNFIKEKIYSIKNEIAEIDKKMLEPSGARVMINRRVFPGVTIIINRRKYVIKNEIINKTFVLSVKEDLVVLA